MSQRVIVVGLDGLEPTVVESLLARGDLPHLARLRAQGGFSRVATTAAAQTPVAWSTFATGVNPGGHGIFDFLRRDPATYRPDIGLTRYEPATTFKPPRAVNLRRGRTIWDELSSRGIASTIIRCPGTYPAEPIQGRLLSGMGVPDLRGGFGTATVYTTDPAARALEGERIVHLAPSAEELIRTEVIGPRNPRDRTDATFPIEVIRYFDEQKAVIRPQGGGGPGTLGVDVFEGWWSDWLPVVFKLGALRTVRGIVRFFLERVGPDLRLYASPVNYDPAEPLFPISHPANYARELADEIGLFHTTGMVEDHAGLNNGRFDEEAFLSQATTAWSEREAMMVAGLNKFESGLFYCLFDTPDRVQHMFWRFNDPTHPSHRGAPTPYPDWKDVVTDQYRHADAMVGLALEAADSDTLVIALSDHGFGPYRREVHLNTWLHEQGLLALKPGLEPGEAAGDMLSGIDWGRTRAYAIGLGGIFLNLKGRERDGIVAPTEAPALQARIAEGLTGLVDPQTGQQPIRRVPDRSALYHGPYASESPDLTAMFERGYRASSSTSLGGVGATVLADNTSKWSGDHIVDPDLVPGVLFLNRPFRGEGASLLDLAPTILSALGVPPTPIMEGKTLL